MIVSTALMRAVAESHPGIELDASERRCLFHYFNRYAHVRFAHTVMVHERRLVVFQPTALSTLPPLQSLSAS